MSDSWISPHHRRSEFHHPLSLDDKITIYEEQLYGWFLDVIDPLRENGAADFVILMTALSLVEGHAIYLQGEDSENRSKQFFKDTFKAMIRPVVRMSASISETNREDLLDKSAIMVYEQARCGFFHDGMTRYGIGLFRGDESGEPGPLTISYAEDRNVPLQISFHAPKFLDALKDYFKEYFAMLRDPANAAPRSAFEKGWFVLHENPVDETRLKPLIKAGVIEVIKVKS
jgi:hypothetical protein